MSTKVTLLFLLLLSCFPDSISSYPIQTDSSPSSSSHSHSHSESHVNSKILFRRPDHPWPRFKNVDDTIRGGSSTSQFGPDPTSRETMIFKGHLDTEKLGGAGFASQSTDFGNSNPSKPALNLSRSIYSGLSLIIDPTFSSRSKEKDHHPHGFVLTIKTEPNRFRKDGRRESAISYEYAFRDDASRRIVMKWDEFKATYRGREDKDAKPLDPSNIYEISFMCRSNFDQQKGDFELKIIELDAVKLSWFEWGKHLLFVRAWSYLASFRSSGNQGVRLV